MQSTTEDHLTDAESGHRLDYVITCKSGFIPYIIDTTDASLRKCKKIFLDDFLYRDSFYEKGHVQEISKYIASEFPVCLGFLGNLRTAKERILVSKRGNYKISKERYEKALEQMQVPKGFHAEFESGELWVNGKAVYEPTDLDDFNKILVAKKETRDIVFGTAFINQLTEKGEMLFIEDQVLKTRHINETEFEYQKYLIRIKEIVGYTFIAESNYKTFYSYLNSFN